MPDQTLAQRVRAKYPGAYDDLTDQELESKVKAKFPGAYDDLPTTPADGPSMNFATVNGQPEAAPREYNPDEFEVLKDVAVGAAKALGRTIQGGGDLLRKIPGVSAIERVIPPVQIGPRSFLEPSNQGERIGGWIGDAAAYFLPATKVEKAISTATKAAPRVVRGLAQMTGQAAAAAPVAAAQGTDPGTAAGIAFLAPPVIKGTVGLVKGGARVVQGAAAGAKEGGLGGAIAGGFQQIVPLPPKSMIVRALKPRATVVGSFDKALDAALPELKATEGQLGRPIGNLDDLLEATKAAKQRIWSQYEELAGPARERGSQVDLSRVAEAVKRSIPSKLRLENPQRAAALEAEANAYRRTFSLDEAERLLLETNAELEAFYSKYPQAQRHALAKDPEAAKLVAQAKELRDAIYGMLDGPGEGAAARELKRRYGALLGVEDVAYRRALVAARQQPESLSEQIGAVRAAGEYAKGAFRVARGDLTGLGNIASAHAQRASAKFLKEQQTTDNLIKRAFASFDGKPSPVPMPPKRPVRGQLGPGALVTPPPADASYVRGVPADYGYREAQRLLPAEAGPGQVVTPAPRQPAGLLREPQKQLGPLPPRGLLPERSEVPPRRYPQSPVGGNQPLGPFYLPGGNAPEAPPTPPRVGVSAPPTDVLRDAPTASGRKPLWQMTRAEAGVGAAPTIPDAPRSARVKYGQRGPTPEEARADSRARSQRRRALADHKRYVERSNAHLRAVEEALAAGKPVPPEVLAEYPWLQSR
jgi:hypothetical protein